MPATRSGASGRAVEPVVSVMHRCNLVSVLRLVTCRAGRSLVSRLHRGLFLGSHEKALGRSLLSAGGQPSHLRFSALSN